MNAPLPDLALLQLLRLTSPGLPIGGYSYSQGLETAIDMGLVHHADSAAEWILGLLAGPLGQFEAPWLADAIRAAEAQDTARLHDINALLLASRDSREPRLETEQMGYSLVQLLSSLPETRAVEVGQIASAGVVGYPVAYALAAVALAVPIDAAVTGFLWGWLENQVMVLMKALPMGQTQGQQLLSRCLPAVRQTAEAALTLPEADRSNFAPLYNWVVLQHETQYSRLFRS